MVTSRPSGSPDALLLLSMEIGSERDVFALRRRAKTCAEAAGLDGRDQVRLATAVSELGRDLLRPQPLSAAFRLRGRDPAELVVVLEWPDGRRAGDESMAAVTRLFPRAVQEPGVQGGRVLIECALPTSLDAVTDQAERIRSALRAEADTGATVIDDLRAQTRDLLAALDESRAQSEELQRLNRELAETNQGVVALYTELSEELEETNRGVVALYAELDEKSRLLREASESKTRFWSNISHELRTPINSVIGLSRLLLDPGSDPLAAEQRRQVELIGAAGNMLLSLVDELLDVAKAEAGQLVPQIAPVDLPMLLTQIHGLMAGAKPSAQVELVVGDGAGLPVLSTDEVMLTRILRNLLSDGLKFTRSGEVRLEVTAQDPDWLLFTVRDTGVGVPEDQQALIFEEFYQVPGPHQRDRPGTGLGLPYARRLAGLLGGSWPARRKRAPR
ncbi:MAG TPA: sensor histidine kinase [Actinocrinis sp.]|jgi:signal transduction histidine kinase